MRQSAERLIVAGEDPAWIAGLLLDFDLCLQMPAYTKELLEKNQQARATLPSRKRFTSTANYIKGAKHLAPSTQKKMLNTLMEDPSLKAHLDLDESDRAIKSGLRHRIVERMSASGRWSEEAYRLRLTNLERRYKGEVFDEKGGDEARNSLDDLLKTGRLLTGLMVDKWLTIPLFNCRNHPRLYGKLLSAAFPDKWRAPEIAEKAIRNAKYRLLTA